MKWHEPRLLQIVADLLRSVMGTDVSRQSIEKVPGAPTRHCLPLLHNQTRQCWKVHCSTIARTIQLLAKSLIDLDEILVILL